MSRLVASQYTLRTLRKGSGLTLQEAARLVRLSKETLIDIEAARLDITEAQSERLRALYQQHAEETDHAKG